MSQNVRQSNLFAAEDFTKIYKSFKNVDFAAYDVDSIQSSLINTIRLNYPESFNDYIQSSEFVAQIQLLSHIAASLAFRTDLNARNNILDTAERRESVIRLARMVNYQPSRNLPLSGVFKITAVETSEPIRDNVGRLLQNQTIFWDDPNNSDSYDQFITVMDAAFSSTNPFGKPYKKQVINNIPTSLYQMNNIKDYEVAYPVNATVGGRSVPFDLCNADLDDDGVLFERHPNPQNAFTLLHRNDGQGLASNNTGFFLFFKQGRLIKKDYMFDLPIKNRVVNVDVENVNETDVFVQEINDAGDVLTEWTKVPNVNGGTNVIYNSIVLNNRDIFAVISDTNDKIKLSFTDGNFGTVPTGIFRTWVRPSLNRNVSLRPEQAQGLEVKVPYVSKDGQQYSLRLVFSLQYNVSNASTTETLDQVKTRAPQVFYTQNRMVNNEDYNVFPLTRGNEIAKVRTINRTHAGHSRYIDINDPTGYHQNLLITSDDGALYKDTIIPSIEVGVDDELNEEIKIASTDITYFIRNRQLTNFFYDDMLLEYKLSKELSYVEGTDTYNKYNVFEFVKNADGLPQFYSPFYQFKPVPDNAYDNKGSIVNLNDEFLQVGPISLEIPAEGESDMGRFSFLRVGAKIKFTDPDDVSNEIYVTVKSISETEEDGSLFVFDRYVPRGWVVNEIFPAYKTTFSQSELDSIARSVAVRNNFSLEYDVETYTWSVKTTYDLNSEFESSSTVGKAWLLVAQYKEDPTTKTRVYELRSRGLEYVFESYRDVRFYFDSDQYNYDAVTGQAKRDIIEVTTQNQMPEIVERWAYDDAGYWRNVDDSNMRYNASIQVIPLRNRDMISDDIVVANDTTAATQLHLAVDNGMVTIGGRTPEIGDVVRISYRSKLPFLKYPIKWNIHDNVYQEDGYLVASKVVVAPADVDSDGVPDLMFSYQKVVAEGSKVFTENYNTFDGYESRRLWISKHISADTIEEIEQITYEDLVESDLFITTPTLNVTLKDKISTVIIDKILDDTLTIEQINQINLVDTTVIYTERYQANGYQLVTDNDPSLPIMEKIIVDMALVTATLEQLAIIGSSFTTEMVLADETLNPVSFTIDDDHFVRNGRTFTTNIQSEEYKKKFNYKWTHFAPVDNRIDPSISNIMDMTLLTASYYREVLIWRNKRLPMSQFPRQPSSEELRLQFSELNNFKMKSDQIIYQPAKFKMLFGKQADQKLRAKFKVVKMASSTLTENEIKTKVIEAVDIYFNIQNWDFGEAFYYTELAAFIHRYLTKYIASVVIVPTDKEAKFGDLFQIKAEPNELFLPMATIDEVEIVSNLTETNLRV